MSKTTTIKVVEIIFDFEMLPREVDDVHVGVLAQAYADGLAIPPIIIDRKTNTLIGGLHRCRAKQRLEGADAVIEAELRDYDTRAEMFLAAAADNSGHGKNLDKYDRARCVLIARRLGVSREKLAGALRMSIKGIKKLFEERTATVRGTQRIVPIKSPVEKVIRVRQGGVITPAQEEAMPKIGGNQFGFYVNQLLLAIRTELIDETNADLMAKLKELASEIRGFLKEASDAA